MPSIESYWFDSYKVGAYKKNKYAWLCLFFTKIPASFMIRKLSRFKESEKIRPPRMIKEKSYKNFTGQQNLRDILSAGTYDTNKQQTNARQNSRFVSNILSVKQWLPSSLALRLAAVAIKKMLMKKTNLLILCTIPCFLYKDQLGRSIFLSFGVINFFLVKKMLIRKTIMLILCTILC